MFQTSPPARSTDFTQRRLPRPGHVRYAHSQVSTSTNTFTVGKVQEAVDWGRFGHRALSRAMHDLDMDAVPLPPSSSGYAPTLLYRRESVGRWLRHNPDFSHKSTHGFAVTTFDVGLPRPLSVVSTHLDPHDPSIARSEAKYIATRAMRYGPYGIVGGDVNYPPAAGDAPVPDYEAMRPYNRAARTRLPSEVEGRTEPERRVTEMLAYSGYVDVADHLYRQHPDPALLRRTGTDDRIDQVWVSRPLAPAIVSYEVLDSAPGASDHGGLRVVLDTDQAVTEDVWDYK